MAARMLRGVMSFSGMTMVSRVLGLVRDQAIQATFGANAMTDAFWVAFRIPNFMRRLFAEGSFSTAFVPVFTEVKETRPHADLRELMSRVSGTLGAILMIVVALGLVFAPQLADVFSGAGGDPGKYGVLVELLRLTFPFILFVSLTALAGGALNSFDRFAIPALTPVILNLCMIAGALWLAPRLRVPILALGWAVLVAGALQLVFQLPALRGLDLLTLPRWGWNHPDVRKVMTLMVPTLFGSSVAQVNLLLNTWVATLLVSGSVSWLYYSDRLLEFPLGMFGVAIGTVILPHLSSRHAETDPDGYSKGLDWGFRLCLLIGLPACAGLILCAQPLLSTLFQYGRFDAADVRMASWSLMAQSIAVPAFLLVKVLAPAFYSRQDTRTPVKAAVVAVLTNAFCTLLFFAAMLYGTEPGRQALQAAGGDLKLALGQVQGAHALLALAIAVAGWVNALQLAWLLRKAGVYRRQPGWGRFLRQIGVATVAMTLVVLAFRVLWPDWTPWAWWDRGWRLAVMVGAGGALYAGLLWVQGIRPRDLRGH